VVEREARIGAQEHFYMETHSVRIVPTGEDGEIVVYSGESHMSAVQVSIAYDAVGWCSCSHVDDGGGGVYGAITWSPVEGPLNLR